jgi:subtilisin family serine protease
MPASAEQLETIRNTPGVRALRAVTNQVFKVETLATERDSTMAALRSGPYAAVVHHAYRHAAAEDGTIYYITDRIVVRFRAGVSPRVATVALARLQLKVLKAYADSRTHLVQVTSGAGENPVKVANRLAEDPAVEFAEPNCVNRFLTAQVPSDTYFPRQWHLNAADGPQLLAAASVDALKAWDVTRGQRSVVVAIIDDGFDLTHPDFTGEGKIVLAKDYVDGDNQPFPSGDDYHGTPCAGVAIAEANGQGVVGMAPGCAFMPVRFPLNADDDLLAEIFEFVGAHADVISCSWGPPPSFAPLSTHFWETLSRLARNGGPRHIGCVICFAAANFDAPVNDPGNKEFRWREYDGTLRTTNGPILNGLAAHPDVVCVAASTSLNKHAFYSNWGAEVSVCAPSNNFNPMSPTEPAPGLGIWTTDNEAFGQGFTVNNRFTGRFGGTSSATPLAAGAAALVRSVNPGLTAPQVKRLLEATADRIVDKDSDPILRVNRGRYDSKGHSDWFGFGKINAGRAVAEAARQLKPQRRGGPVPRVRAAVEIVPIRRRAELADVNDDVVAIELRWGSADEATLVEISDNEDPIQVPADARGRGRITVRYPCPHANSHTIQWRLAFPGLTLKDLTATARREGEAEAQTLKKSSSQEQVWAAGGVLA